MLHKKYLLLLCFLLLPFSLYAKSQTSAVASPACDQKKIEKIAGDALVSIKKAEWAGDLKGFYIALNTEKMSFAVLTKKMLEAGCFKGM